MSDDNNQDISKVLSSIRGMNEDDKSEDKSTAPASDDSSDTDGSNDTGCINNIDAPAPEVTLPITPQAPFNPILQKLQSISDSAASIEESKEANESNEAGDKEVESDTVSEAPVNDDINVIEKKNPDIPLIQKMVAFVGVDFSGKTTTIGILASDLRARGYAVSTWKFPRKSSEYGKRIYSILNRQEEFDIEGNCFEFAKLYALDRLEAMEELKADIASHDFTLVDRYTLCNAIYTTAIRSIVTTTTVEEQLTIITNILKSEIGKGVVPPDLYICMNIPKEELVSFLSKPGRDKYEQKDRLMIVDHLYKVIVQPDKIIPYVPSITRASLITALLEDHFKADLDPEIIAANAPVEGVELS